MPDHYQHRDARALLPALRAARTAAKISQLEMCAILGVADGVVSHWEGGSRKPSLEMLCLYAEGLGLKITVVPRDQHPDAPPPSAPITAPRPRALASRPEPGTSPHARAAARREREAAE